MKFKEQTVVHVKKTERGKIWNCDEHLLPGMTTHGMLSCFSLVVFQCNLKLKIMLRCALVVFVVLIVCEVV